MFRPEAAEHAFTEDNAERDADRRDPVGVAGGSVRVNSAQDTSTASDTLAFSPVDQTHDPVLAQDPCDRDDGQQHQRSQAEQIQENSRMGSG